MRKGARERQKMEHASFKEAYLGIHEDKIQKRRENHG